jgi:hypothetical protein
VRLRLFLLSLLSRTLLSPFSKSLVVLGNPEHHLPGSCVSHLLCQSTRLFGSLPPMFGIIENVRRHSQKERPKYRPWRQGRTRKRRLVVAISLNSDRCRATYEAADLDSMSTSLAVTRSHPAAGNSHRVRPRYERPLGILQIVQLVEQYLELLRR